LSQQRPTGVILCGGKSSRMLGQTKAFVDFAGETLLDRIIRRFESQVHGLILSVAEDQSDYQSIDFPKVNDIVSGPHGPLMGLASAFQSTEAKVDLVLCPCDAPFVPSTLVAALEEKILAENADIVCPSYEGELQPTFALWNKRTAHRVIQAATKEGIGGLRVLYSEFNAVQLEWPKQKRSPFFNINTPEDLNFARESLTD
jgi:molybdopterin-guanine dinucleotide biosynthesis protein A